MTDLFEARAVEVLGLVLLHSLWQGLAVAAAAGLALAFVRRAAVRYRIACLGLLALLAWPTLTGIDLALNAIAPTHAPMVAAEGEPAEGAPPVVGVQAPAPAALEDAAGPAEGERTRVRTGPSVVEPAPVYVDRLRARLVPSLVMLWCIGVLVGLARLTLGLAFVARLRRSARPAEAAVVHAARGIATDVGLRAHVIVLETHRLSAPVVVGVMRPALLLPLGISSSLPPAQLEAVLAHELAHVLRRDYLVNLLQRLAETLLFHHPAAWWLSNVVRTEREHLCDDAAVRAVGGDPLPLARALATLEQHRGGARIAAMGARGPGRAEGELLGRVRRLLGRDATGGPRRVSLALQAALPALLLGLVAVAGPALAQVQGESSSPVGGRYGTLTVAGEDEPLAYVQMRRTAESSDDRFTRRLLDPSGDTVSAEAWGTDTDAWSERFELEPPGTWTLEIEADGRGEAAHYDLELDPEAALEPVFQSVDDMSRFGWGNPVFGEDGQVVDWDADPADAGPHLLWDPVPGAGAYYVNIAPVGRSTGWSPLSPHEDRLVPGDVTSFSLASLPAGEYELRVHAFSADPRVDLGAETLKRVDESVSRTRRYRSDRVVVEPVAPEGELEIVTGWVDDRLRITLPKVGEAVRWDVWLRPAWDVERRYVLDLAFRSLLDGATREAFLARAEELVPGVPYLVEARALPEAPQTVPPFAAAAVDAIAVGYAGPVYAPESSSEEALLGVQFGHYSHPLAEHGIRVTFHVSDALEGDAEVALIGSSGRELRRHEITPSETLSTYVSSVAEGTYRAQLQVGGETLEERAFTLPEGELLPRPEGIRLKAPLGVAEVPQVDVADPGAVAWDPVPGADRYQVRLERAGTSGSIVWVMDVPRVDLTEFPFPLEPQAYELEVRAFRGGFGAGPGDVVAQDVSVSDPFVFEAIDETATIDAPAPFHLRYGHYLGENTRPELYLHLDLAPDGRSGTGPAEVRVLDARGGMLTFFEVEDEESAVRGGFSADPERAASVEVTTDDGTWRVPLEVPPAPAGFGPVDSVRVERVDTPGGAVLTWDSVPATAVYDVGLFPVAGGPARLVSAAEPFVALAGLEPGTYEARVWAYTRNPSTPAHVLTTNVATAFLGEVEVPASATAEAAVPGAVQGIVRTGRTPAAGIAVYLFPPSFPAATGPRAPRTAVTDEEGRYRFGDVPPGRYSASVPMVPPITHAAPVMAPATSLTVAAGETTVAADVHAVPLIEPHGVLASGTAMPGEVELAWEPVAGAASYLVTLRERTTSSVAWEAGSVLANARLEEPAWTVQLEPGRVHEVGIEALDAGGHRIGRVGLELRTTPSR